MMMTRKLTLTVSALAILAAGAAQADVTAQQVWDNWKEQTAIYGEGFTFGSEELSGDTLTVSDVAIELSDPETTVTAAIGDINLTENGDGTVTVTMAEAYPITIAVDPRYGDPGTIDAMVRQIGMSLVVSGDPDAMVYDIAADSYSIGVEGLTGGPAEEVNLRDAIVTLSGISGRYAITEGDLRDIVYALNVDMVDLDVLITEPGGTGRFEFSGDMANLTTQAKVSLPADLDLDAPEPPFDDGLALSGGYSFGDLRYAFDFAADGEEGSGELTSSGGDLNIAFDFDGMAYGGEARDIAVSALFPSEFPLPVEASLGSYAYELLVPLSQGDGEPRDARMAISIRDLQISDMLWNIADPATLLPRDPITVAIGIDAEVSPFFDFLDPDQMQAAAMSDVPGELHSATITELVVRAAGAEITGEGGFTFDNTDLATFDGLPRPEGSMSFAINGVNGLVDTLIQMGLIPEADAMMPRMMLGMFATPVGDDMLTSTIEVNSEGHVLANGQRLR
ncbi:MAG: DUF2125 domain-containing protein [Pseudomonadota bacterium]